MLLPSMHTAANSSFETQRRCHQKSKTRVSVAPQIGLISSKNLKQKKTIQIKEEVLSVSLLDISKISLKIQTVEGLDFDFNH